MISATTVIPLTLWRKTMATMITLSKTPLASVCTHWTVLEIPFEPHSDASQLGDMLHLAIACALLGRPIPRFEDCKIRGRHEIHQRFWNWYRWADNLGLMKKNDGDIMLVEQKVAYDPRTGKSRLLPGDGQRDYSAAEPGELCGTIDLAKLTKSANGSYDILILDWKTFGWNQRGQWRKVFRDATEDLQVRGAAAILAGIYDVHSLRAGLIYIPPPVGACEPFGSIVEIDPVDEVGEIMMRLDRCIVIDDKPIPGEHCSALYCPAGPKKKKVCSAWK